MRHYILNFGFFLTLLVFASATTYAFPPRTADPQAVRAACQNQLLLLAISHGVVEDPQALQDPPWPVDPKHPEEQERHRQRGEAIWQESRRISAEAEVAIKELLLEHGIQPVTNRNGEVALRHGVPVLEFKKDKADLILGMDSALIVDAVEHSHPSHNGQYQLRLVDFDLNLGVVVYIWDRTNEVAVYAGVAPGSEEMDGRALNYARNLVINPNTLELTVSTP